MEIQGMPFDSSLLRGDVQIQSLPAQPLMVRILQMFGVVESSLPNVWACGGLLLALAATVASIVTGARLLRQGLEQRRANQERFCHRESSICFSVPQNSFDEIPGIELGASSCLIPSDEVQNKQGGNLEGIQRDPSRQGAQSDLIVVRKSENWATARDRGTDYCQGDARRVMEERTRNMPGCIISEIWTLGERGPMPALFRPLIESLSKLEEFDGEDIMNMNLRHAWEKGVLKLKQWQQEMLSPHSFFGKGDVVKFWDNLKGKALRTFYVQQGFALALDSGWMYGITSLGTTPQGILSPWDSDKATSLSAISARRGRIESLCMGPSNAIIAQVPVHDSGRSELKLWDARIGPRPIALNGADPVVRRLIFNIPSCSLHTLYLKHDENKVSIHDLRMLGSSRIGTLSLEAPKFSEKMEEREHDLSPNSASTESVGTEDTTWWDTDAVIVNDDEERLCDGEDIYDDGATGVDHGPSTQSVVSWCLGAVRSISSSLTK